MYSCYQRARDGDPRATEAVIRALRPRLTRMAAYYARHTGEDPDDLLQEAWVGLLEALAEVDITIGSPGQYLIKHARWRLLNVVKRERVRRCLPLEEDAIICHSGPEHALSSACAFDFQRRLNSMQGAVLGCLLRGMTWREAGAALGCTSANIAYHVRQIRRIYAEWSA